MDKQFKFYGVCGNQYKLDETIWEAIEDESDGYRSYLDTIIKVESDSIFQREPIAIVTVREIQEGDADGYELVDVEDGHVWLRIGTENTCDYYPYFVFQYTINENKKVKTEVAEITETTEDEWKSFIGSDE